MGQGLTDRFSGPGDVPARNLLLGATALVVVVVAVALVIMGVTTGEVAATVLFLPVFAAGLVAGRSAGYAAAGAATLAYVALRRSDLSSAGAASAGVLTLTRAAAYGVAGHVGSLVGALVPQSAAAPAGAARTGPRAGARPRADAAGGPRPMPRDRTAHATPWSHPAAPRGATDRPAPVLAGVGASGGDPWADGLDPATETTMSGAWPPGPDPDQWGRSDDAPPLPRRNGHGSSQWDDAPADGWGDAGNGNGGAPGGRPPGGGWQMGDETRPVQDDSWDAVQESWRSQHGVPTEERDDVAGGGERSPGAWPFADDDRAPDSPWGGPAGGAQGPAGQWGAGPTTGQTWTSAPEAPHGDPWGQPQAEPPAGPWGEPQDASQGGPWGAPEEAPHGDPWGQPQEQSPAGHWGEAQAESPAGPWGQPQAESPAGHWGEAQEQSPAGHWGEAQEQSPGGPWGQPQEQSPGGPWGQPTDAQAGPWGAAPSAPAGPWGPPEGGAPPVGAWDQHPPGPDGRWTQPDDARDHDRWDDPPPASGDPWSDQPPGPDAWSPEPGGAFADPAAGRAPAPADDPWSGLAGDAWPTPSGQIPAVPGPQFSAAGGPPGPDAPTARRTPLPAVDPETGLWTAQFLRDRLNAERARSQRGGHPFSLVLVQVPDGPLAQLPYRRQVTLLRELGYQFVAGGVVDHLVHVPDQAQHWFAVILPDTDRSGAQVLERRLRLGIGGYLSSRGLRLRDLDSASLTAPDDDPAMGAIWDALLGPGGS